MLQPREKDSKSKINNPTCRSLEFYSLSMEQLNSSHNHDFWLLLIHTTMNHKEITDLHKNPMLRKQTGGRQQRKKTCD